MNWKRLGYNPSVVYHYTKKSNVDSIIKDKKIKKFRDIYTFFTESYESAIYLLEKVTCNPRCATIGFDGITRPNRNSIEDFCVLELEIDKNYIDTTKWYESNSAFGDNKEKVAKINSSICYQGDVRFKNCKILEIEKN